jgi:hypothetical protein
MKIQKAKERNTDGPKGTLPARRAPAPRKSTARRPQQGFCADRFCGNFSGNSYLAFRARQLQRKEFLKQP